MVLFPQNSGIRPSSSSSSVSKEHEDDDDDDDPLLKEYYSDDDFSGIRQVKELESTAPMTIFNLWGKGTCVVVFNNITVTKAKQIFNYAATNATNNNAIFSSHSAIPPPPPPTVLLLLLLLSTGNHKNNNFNNSGVIPSVISASNLAPSSAAASTAAGNPGMMMMMISSKQHNFKAPKLSDLPIQRKASLHRFLEKRKDRINARTPYNQVNSPKSTGVTDKVLQQEEKEESKLCLISSAY